MRSRAKITSLGCLIPVLLATICLPTAKADDNGKKDTRSTIEARQDCSLGVAFAALDINNVWARLYNIGGLFWRSGSAGYRIPNTTIGAVFASGIWVGGLANGEELRMAAAGYRDWEFWPGPLDENGNPPADCSRYDRIYNIYREDVERLLRDGPSAATPDIVDWPAHLGAPFVDVNQDVQYDIYDGDYPDILGDQMAWWVMNDAGGSHLTTKTPAIGLEVQVTAFAFQSADALNNTTFYKYKYLYRGSERFEDVYIGLWSDPDLGFYGDDFVGSDTTLGLGFVYNGDPFDEGNYLNRPPALGYDFFQGPLVDSDGRDNDRDGSIDEPEERLKMTRFVYYNNDGTDQGNPTDAADYYGYLRGRWRDGSPITFGGDGYGDDLGLGPTNYMFTGDPPGFWSEDNTDGQGSRNTPADRRFLMSTGPFTMEPGDEQEIVFGIVWSQTPDRIGSVKKLKRDDILAQGAFDFDFDVPPPPDAPQLAGQALDGEIVLSWHYTATSNNYINSYDAASPYLIDPAVSDTTYTFEGYKIFQYASPADFPNDGVLVATLDVKNGITTIIENTIDIETGAPVQVVAAKGNDSGVKNFMVLERDHVKEQPLRNYTDYYFGVQAYAYNPFSDPRVYQSPVAGNPDGGPLRITPSKISARDGGIVLNSESGDVLLAEIDKPSDAIVGARVVDPAAVTGDTYELRFFHIEDRLTYELVNTSAGETVISGDKLPPLGEDVFIHDGLSFTVKNPPLDFAGHGGGIIEVSYPGIDPCGAEASSPAGCGTYGGNTVWHSLNSTASYYIAAGGGDGGLNRLTRYIAHAVPRDFEIRFTESGGLAVYAFSDNTIASVPFELWDLGVGTPGDPSDDRRMIPFLVENTETSGIWGWATGVDPWAGFPMSDWIYWMDPMPETDGYLAFEAAALAAGGPGGTYPVDTESVHRNYYANFYGGFVYPIGRMAIADFADEGTPPPTGTVIRLITTKPIGEGDVYAIDTAPAAPTRNHAPAAAEALKRAAIVPNPYRGSSSYDVSAAGRRVRITNLPYRATINVYALNGTRVRTLEKNSPSAFLTWNLRTEEGLPVSSGVYIVHIDAPEIGEKVLKFAVVQPRIELRVY